MVATAVKTTAGSLFAQVPLRVTPDGVTRSGIGQHRDNLAIATAVDVAAAAIAERRVDRANLPRY
jgi:hypothetical protein